jgi:hypothetical protein
MTPTGPWVCLNRMKGLTATNTLYSVHFLKRLTLYEKAAWSLALVASTAAAQHAEVGRRYSDGLLKFEPRDVMSLKIPRPVNTGPEALQVYQLVVAELLGDDQNLARSMAELFAREGRSR